MLGSCMNTEGDTSMDEEKENSWTLSERGEREDEEAFDKKKSGGWGWAVDKSVPGSVKAC